METFRLSLFAIVLLVAGAYGANVDPPFGQYYNALWGANHLIPLNHGREVQLLLDRTSGAGFRSKLDYKSGLFGIRMKLPHNKSPGVVTTFYLTSQPDNQPSGNHDELDFEFLGNHTMPYTLQTNVFSDDLGGREQRIHLWFDPTKDFHAYEILWNSHQIVFFIDRIPIRVFKNNRRYGINYPSQAMHIEGSLWAAGGTWAGKIDWSQAPFSAYYGGFNIDGCSNALHCDSLNYYWNQKQYWKLSPLQLTQLQNVRNKFMFYDYCTDRPQKECHIH